MIASSCRWILLAVSLLPCLASAQSVRGTVTDSASGQPVDAFAAFLLDATNAVVAQGWAREGGRFFLQAPAAGQYRVRIQRIGFRKATSAVFELGASEARGVRISMVHVAATLVGMHVSANPRCEALSEGSAGDVATAWEAARTAFELMSASGSRRDLIVKVLNTATDESIGRRVASSVVVDEHEGRSIDPYPAANADSVSRFGYVHAGPDHTEYYAPAASILMSGSFLHDHCFHLQAADRDADRIGVAFEPARDREVPEVSGVIWLHRSTWRPLTLDYSYVMLPRSIQREMFGGHAEFLEIPDGAWLLREWNVRAPIVDVTQHSRLSGGSLGNAMSMSRVTDSTLSGVHDERGRILFVRSPEGRVIWADSLGSVVGVVTDGGTDEPLTGVEVSLAGSPRHARTDERGRFTVDSIVPGKYTLSAGLKRFGVKPVSAARDIKVVTSVTRANMVLPQSAATAEAALAARDDVRKSCAILRDRRERELDAEYRIAPAEWHATGSDSSAMSRAVQQAIVVLEAVADTAGRAEMSTVRIMKSANAAWMSEAMEAMRTLDAGIQQPEPGCKVRHLIVLPYVPRKESP